MLKKSENNGMEEIGLVTPTPVLWTHLKKCTPDLALMGELWARFLSLAQSELRLCSTNHRAGYFSNLACDWLSIVWAHSEQETERGHIVSIVSIFGENKSCYKILLYHKIHCSQDATGPRKCFTHNFSNMIETKSCNDHDIFPGYKATTDNCTF